MLFFSFVGWLAFISTSILLAIIAWAVIYRELFRTEKEARLEALQMAMRGDVFEYNHNRVLVIFAIWMMSGGFIFGAF